MESIEKKIKKQYISIMGHKDWVWLGGVMCFGKWSMSDTMPTACTDGKNVWFGREFCAKLSEAELRFLILHETMHKAARHMQIYKTMYKSDPQRANAACDYWINNELVKQDAGKQYIKMISGGLFNPKYDGWTVVDIFKDLEDKEQEGGCGTGDKDNHGNEITEGYPSGGGFDEHDWDSLSPEEKETLAKDIEIAIRQGRQLAGKMDGNKPRTIDGLLEGRVDWRKELAEFIKQVMNGKDETSWSKMNRRMFHMGNFPGSISTTVGRIAIAIDTSGSIGGSILAQFMGEVKKLCAEVRPAGVDILWWDTQVCSVQSFDESQMDNLTDTLRPAGGGGTNPECVAQWLQENQRNNYECVVLLSDGYVSGWPVFNIPSLWAMISDIVAPHGKTVKIADEENL